jgi:hypothetical protein
LFTSEIYKVEAFFEKYKDVLTISLPAKDDEKGITDYLTSLDELEKALADSEKEYKHYCTTVLADFAKTT